MFSGSPVHDTVTRMLCPALKHWDIQPTRKVSSATSPASQRQNDPWCAKSARKQGKFSQASWPFRFAFSAYPASSSTAEGSALSDWLLLLLLLLHHIIASLLQDSSTHESYRCPDHLWGGRKTNEIRTDDDCYYHYHHYYCYYHCHVWHSMIGSSNGSDRLTNNHLKMTENSA